MTYRAERRRAELALDAFGTLAAAALDRADHRSSSAGLPSEKLLFRFGADLRHVLVQVAGRTDETGKAKPSQGRHTGERCGRSETKRGRATFGRRRATGRRPSAAEHASEPAESLRAQTQPDVPGKRAEDRVILEHVAHVILRLRDEAAGPFSVRLSNTITQRLGLAFGALAVGGRGLRCGRRGTCTGAGGDVLGGEGKECGG